MQGQVINGFVLKKLLGEGGMAEVWYAENEIGKPAAVKILFEKLTRNEQIVERFHNEAIMMVKLKHPNIRQVYGYGYLNNRHCIIMEYLEGDDLSDMMKNGRRFTDAELRKWWNQIVSALNYTHAQGIVHRDIKPSNIFLDEDGNIKLLDFGIAKMMENSSLTQTGSLMGTLMYMSPEQVKDAKNIDYRTDIYSLAVSFVHLLTGKKPYNTDTTSDFEIRERIVYTPYDVSVLPPEWQGFLAPYLEKEPDKRPALRPFEAAAPMAETTTVISERPTNANATKARQSQPQPVTNNPTITTFSDGPTAAAMNEKPKKKVGLWIGIGAAALVVLIAAVVLFLNHREKSIQTEIDNAAYQACITADDYRAYMHDFGSDGLHYNDAKAEIDRLVADSTAKALQAIAEEQARQQAEAE
ncbi:MAG: serine/threonine protein kinase, partial [Bacteroidales bacterium]|nr:serine/threonine protein kinase [Bacteroidales bacterium]